MKDWTIQKLLLEREYLKFEEVKISLLRKIKIGLESLLKSREDTKV